MDERENTQRNDISIQAQILFDEFLFIYFVFLLLFVRLFSAFSFSRVRFILYFFFFCCSFGLCFQFNFAFICMYGYVYTTAHLYFEFAFGKLDFLWAVLSENVLELLSFVCAFAKYENPIIWNLISTFV